MSEDPVAVIYSASLSGRHFVPRAQMEVRAPSPDQVHGLEGLVCGQVREGAGSDRFAIMLSATACAISGLVKPFSARRALNHFGGRGRETALVDSSGVG